MAVSAQRRRRVLVAVVAALIAVGAFYLAVEYAGKSATPPAGSSTTPPTTAQTVSVVVASTAISQAGKLDGSNLTTESWLKSQLPPSAAGTPPPYYTSVATLTGTSEYATVAIPQGTLIESSMVTASLAAAQSAPVPGTNFDLPKGYVAMSLPYTPGAGQGEMEGEGTGGYIFAGDRVDILVQIDPNPNPDNLEGTMYWAYQDVLVLAVGQSSGSPVVSQGAQPAASASASSTVSASLVMVELPQQDAANMTYLENSKNATIQYLIVSSKDYPSPSGTAAPSIGSAPTNITNGSNPGFFGG